MLTLKIISLYSSDDTCRKIETMAGAIEGVSVNSRPLNGNLANRMHSLGIEESCDALFIEFSQEFSEDVLTSVEEEIARISETTPVFATFETSDVKLMRRLLKAGVRDVFMQPLERDEIVNELSHVMAEKRERIMNSKGGLSSVYSFVNAKGGSGASTLAVNFAVELARLETHKVALVDLDLQLGACDAQLDLTPTSTVFDAITQSDRVDAVLIRALMTTHESGLDVLPSPGHLTSISDVSVQDIRRVLDGLADAYDIVVLDVPTIFNAWILEVLKMSERVMLVLQNEFSAIKSARTVIDCLPAMGVAIERIELVNNRAHAKSPAATIEELKATLGVARVHRIRSDFPACIAAHSQGKPVSKVAPASKFVKDIQRMAQYAHYSVMHPGEDPVNYMDGSIWSKFIGR